MKILTQYPFLEGSRLVRNHGDKAWHVVKPDKKLDECYCHRICTDQEETTTEEDGVVCARCVGLWDYHNNPKSYKGVAKRPGIPKDVIRTAPVNPTGDWRGRWATTKQQRRIRELYPEKGWMELDGLTSGEASDLIKARQPE